MKGAAFTASARGEGSAGRPAGVEAPELSEAAAGACALRRSRFAELGLVRFFFFSLVDVPAVVSWTGPTSSAASGGVDSSAGVIGVSSATTGPTSEPRSIWGLQRGPVALLLGHTLRISWERPGKGVNKKTLLRLTGDLRYRTTLTLHSLGCRLQGRGPLAL